MWMDALYLNLIIRCRPTYSAVSVAYSEGSKYLGSGALAAMAVIATAENSILKAGEPCRSPTPMTYCMPLEF